MLDKKLLDLANGKNFAFVGTISKNGYPHVTPMWVDADGDNIIINTVVGRVKQKNAVRENRICVTIQNHANPYNYAMVQGIVIEQRTEGAEEHIDKLAKKYTGQDRYTNGRPGEKRIMLIVKPERVHIQ